MNFEKIIEIIETAVHGFEVQIGVKPNRIKVSADVFDYLRCIGMVSGGLDIQLCIMGMATEITYDKEQFIEVGYMTSAKSY